MGFMLKLASGQVGFLLNFAIILQRGRIQSLLNVDHEKLGLRVAAWLQAKVRDCWLTLRPKLFAGFACDNGAAEAAIMA